MALPNLWVHLTDFFQFFLGGGGIYAVISMEELPNPKCFGMSSAIVFTRGKSTPEKSQKRSSEQVCFWTMSIRFQQQLAAENSSLQHACIYIYIYRCVCFSEVFRIHVEACSEETLCLSWQSENSKSPPNQKFKANKTHLVHNLSPLSLT